MSQRVGKTFVVESEPPQTCELCGVVAELRPYGPHGEAICFDCGMKDRKTTDRMFRAATDGVDTVIVIPGAES